MDKKIFEVYLAKEGIPNNEAYAKLNLPASPWELWDAMEKVRLKDGEALYMEIDDYYGPGVKFCVSDFRQSQEWRWKAGRILA